MSSAEVLTPESFKHLVSDQLLRKIPRKVQLGDKPVIVRAADYGVYAEEDAHVHIEERIIKGFSKTGLERNRRESVIRADIPEDPRAYTAIFEGDNMRTLTVIEGGRSREIGPEDTPYLRGIMQRLVDVA